MKLPTQIAGVDRMDRAAQAAEIKAAGFIASSCPCSGREVLEALKHARNNALKPTLG